MSREKKCINDVDIFSQEEFNPNDTIFVLDGYCFEISSFFQWIFKTIYPLIPTEYFSKIEGTNPATNKEISKKELTRLNSEYSKYWFKKHMNLYITFLGKSTYIETLAKYQLFEIIDDLGLNSSRKIKLASTQTVVNEKYIDKVLKEEKIDDWDVVAKSFAYTGLDRYINCLKIIPTSDIRNIVIGALSSGNIDAVRKIEKMYDIKVFSMNSVITDDIVDNIFRARDIGIMNYMLENKLIPRTSVYTYDDIIARYLAHGNIKKAEKYYILQRADLYITRADPEYKLAFVKYKQDRNNILTQDELDYCLERTAICNKYELIDILFNMGAIYRNFRNTDLSSVFYLLSQEQDVKIFTIFFKQALRAKNYLACALLLEYNNIEDRHKIYWLACIANEGRYDLMKYYISQGVNPASIFLMGIEKPEQKLIDFVMEQGNVDFNDVTALFISYRFGSTTTNEDMIKFINILLPYTNFLNTEEIMKKIKLFSLQPIDDRLENESLKIITALKNLIETFMQ